MKYCLEDLFNQLVLNLNEKDEIKLLKEKTNLEFVYGKGKRKSKLQKYAEGLEDFIEKQSKYDNYNEIFNGRNSFSKTDKDATFMHMKEKNIKNKKN